MKYHKMIKDAAKHHIENAGEYPLEDAGCGMYNLNLKSNLNGLHPDLQSKYDVIVQCYPYSQEFTNVWLLIPYDSQEGIVDHYDCTLGHFDDDVKQKIVEAYIKALGD